MNQTRLRIPPDPCTKLSSPHNERAQKVLLTKSFGPKVAKKLSLFSQLSAPIKSGLKRKLCVGEVPVRDRFLHPGQYVSETCELVDVYLVHNMLVR